MAKYCHTLPQLGGRLLLAAGALENTLIFHDSGVQ